MSAPKIDPPADFVVQPEVHESGLVWHYAQALAAEREACPRCRPSIPCFRHVQPSFDLVGYSAMQSFGSPALGAGACTGCGAGGYDRLPVMAGDRGTMLARACPDCIAKHVGPVVGAPQ